MENVNLQGVGKLRGWHYSSGVIYTLCATTLYFPVLLLLLQTAAYAETPGSGADQQPIKQAETMTGMNAEKLSAKSQAVNPHWRKEACFTCHVSEPGGGSALKVQSDGTCFNCHRVGDHVSIHPINRTPGKDMLARMPKEFSQNLGKTGKTNCLSCHDILMQCRKPKSTMRLRNSSFLRGGYYNTRTGVCYQCHNKAAYKKLNAHDQINDKGVLDTGKCLICHRSVPKQELNGGTIQVSMQVDSDWSQICLNCHRWQPHPGGNMTMFSGGKPPNHLVVPDDIISSRLAEMTQRNHLAMPLEPDSGKVYCATCHNPHERGVIKKISLAKGADEKNRLRSKRICINCHEK